MALESATEEERPNIEALLAPPAPIDRTEMAKARRAKMRALGGGGTGEVVIDGG